MRSGIPVEFVAKAGGKQFEEESIQFQDPQELFEFISPGGGCDRIPDEVDEIQMLFRQPAHANTHNPLADQRVTLQIGMVFFTGPLAEIVQSAQQILDKAERGELSQTFLTVIG